MKPVFAIPAASVGVLNAGARYTLMILMTLVYVKTVGRLLRIIDSLEREKMISDDIGTCSACGWFSCLEDLDEDYVCIACRAKLGKPMELKEAQSCGSWCAYDRVAEDLARKGLTGKIGDPLPANLSGHVLNLINDDPEAFGRRVRQIAYMRAMEGFQDGLPNVWM